MARHSQAVGTANQAKAAKRRRATPGRIIGTIVVVALVGVALFYGIGGWHFSNRLHDDFFLVQEPDPVEYELTALSVGSGEITLAGDSTNLTHPGLFGVRWPEGYAQAGEVQGTTIEDSGLTVTRSYLSSDDTLSAGTSVDLDTYAYRGDPGTAFGVEFEEVTFDSDVGTLGAWFVPGDTDTWMIMVHGRGNNPVTNREEVLRWLPIAVERGYNALIIDYRNDPGRGRDESGWYQYGLTEWEDVASAANYARASGADDIVVVGVSMGGGAVINFLAKSPLRNQTVAAILDAPVMDAGAVVDHNAQNTPLGIGPWNVPDSLTAVSKWIASVRWDIDWDSYNYLEQWREWHVPMLVFHGSDDKTVPVETSRLLASQRPDLVELIVTPGVDHVRSWNYDPQAYSAAVNEFLDQYAGR